MKADKKFSYYHQEVNRAELLSDLPQHLTHIPFTNPETYLAEHEKFMHNGDDDFLPFFLESELHLLSNARIYVDGTYSLVRHLDHYYGS